MLFKRALYTYYFTANILTFSIFFNFFEYGNNKTWKQAIPWEPRTPDQVFLDKFLGNFTCSCVQWTSFFRKFSFTSFICSWVVCTTGQVFLDDDARSEQWRNAQFIVQFPLLAVNTNNCSCLKAGVTNFWITLLVKEKLSVNLWCTHEKIKLLTCQGKLGRWLDLALHSAWLAKLS